MGVGMTTKLHGEDNFTWRGADVSRLENLSDIVFALVITLAAAQTVPTRFEELTSLWRDAISLAACFAYLLVIWRMHHVFFRRYDLQDNTTMVLNAIILFLVLVYIYPLKFMTDFVTNYFTGAYDMAEIPAILSLVQVKYLYVIYGLFFAGLYGAFALLYAHALRRADDIGLNARERSYTRFEIEQAIGVCILTAIVIAAAFVLPQILAPFAGILFSLMGANSYLCAKRAEARLA